MLSKLSKKLYLGDRPYPGDSLVQEAFFTLKLPSFLPDKYAQAMKSKKTTSEKMTYFKNLYNSDKRVELGK